MKYTAKKNLIIVISMIFIMLAVPCAYAQDKMIFDLDLSQYNEETKIVSDKSAEENEITVKNVPQSGSVTVNEEIPYVVFNTEENNIVSNFRLLGDSFINQSKISAEFWCCPYFDNENDRVLFSISKSNLSNATMYVSLKGSELTFHISDTNEKKVDISSCLNEFNHYIFTREYTDDGKVNYCLYINGFEKINETADEALNDETGKYFYIGAPGNLNSQVNYTFRGGISEARIYNYIIDSKEALNNYSIQSKRYIKKEDNDGENDKEDKDDFVLDFSAFDGNNFESGFSDKSSNNADVTGSGEIIKKTYSSIGMNVDYLEMNTDEKKTCAYLQYDGKNIANKDKLSIECWARPRDFSKDYGCLFSIIPNKGTDSTDCFRAMFFNLQSRPSVRYFDDADGTSYIDKWMYFVFEREYDPENNKIIFRMYANGNLVQSGERLDMKISDESNANFFIGGVPGRLEQCFKGDIASFKIHTKILSAEEIKAKYDEDKGKFVSAYYWSDLSNKINGNTEEALFNFNSLIDFTAFGENTFFVTEYMTEKRLPVILKNITPSSFSLQFRQYLKHNFKYKVASNSLKLTDGNYVDTFNTFVTEPYPVKASVMWYGENGIKTDKPVFGNNRVRIEIEGSLGHTYKYTLLEKDQNNITISAYSGNFGTYGDFDINIPDDAASIKLYVLESNGINDTVILKDSFILE